MGAPGAVVADEGVIDGHGGVEAVGQAADTLLPQDAHEELQADEGEHAQAEHGQDHHVRQLLHRLDQGPHDGLQAWGERGSGGERNTRRSSLAR